jgi:hypothetical protein
MEQKWHIYDLAWPESFEIRRPVLDVAPSLRGRWRLSEDRKYLETDLDLSDYSSSERVLIRFAIDPWHLPEKSFENLDKAMRRELATAIYKFFGPGGPVDQRGW